MLLFLKKLGFFAFAASLLGLVVYSVEPPQSWTTASLEQILLFFIPLLLVFTLFVNLFLSYLPHSFIIALGGIMLIVLLAVNLFTYLSAGVVIGITILAIKLFPKLRYPNLRLTRKENIPKLSKLRRD